MKRTLIGDDELILDKIFEILERYLNDESTDKIAITIEAFKRGWKLKAEVKKTNEA